jgi:glycosyltransferase involved in cell wall biosynthesis
LTHVTPSGGGVETDKLHRIGTRDLYNYKIPIFFTFRRMGNSFINNVAVVEALKLLKDEYKITARFVICGYKSSPFYKLIKLKAKELGIFEHISVIPPFPYSHLAHILSKYNYVISAATHDGTTNALLETMWLGGIPLNGPYEPLNEWIEDGINGYLFDTNNPSSISKKMYQCLQDASRHEIFKKINQEIIKKRADYSTCMRKVKEIYSLIVATNK